ncbi:hypothetical protein BCV70DRAFT_199834 [Testicularia cyperi]|uniref:FHA domain-containing protein n=1 Tax=Testicularia cyperi TaxID=1882483 RepID=A0A317XRZ4_9BASI|nr:hypothetical protein BCV70DRAFT_199834 [Testicularia cyperi]
MMHDLPTPAPSSDPPMPGSSPTKPLRHLKALAAAAGSAVKAGGNNANRPFTAMPFTPLDLNIIGDRAKAFEEERRKAGATPPPSSPPPSAFASSPPAPSTEQRRVFGFSPTKQQRVAAPRLSHAARDDPIGITSDPASTVEAPLSLDLSHPDDDDQTRPIGLVANPEAETDADGVPHLLFASRTISLVIGRCKPSGLPHTYAPSGATAADTPSSTQGLGAKRILRVNLPNDARHVSRVHAIVEWIPFVFKTTSTFGAAHKKHNLHQQQQQQQENGTFVVRIVGQNGLIVDGKRRREGQVLRLAPGKSLIDFFGFKCRLEYVPTKAERQAAARLAASEKARHERGSSHVTSPVKRVNKSVAMPTVGKRDFQLPSSPPPSSSPLAALQFNSPTKVRNAVPANSTENQDDEDDVQSSPTPAGRRRGGLTAGPLAIKSVKAGASDDEAVTTSKVDKLGQDLNASSEEEDESDDEDYVPEALSTPSKTGNQILQKQLQKNVSGGESQDAKDVEAVTASAAVAAVPTTQVERVSSKSGATSSAKSTPRKRTPNSAGAGRSRESSASAKPAHADALSESQTKMPPPAAAAASAVVASSAARSSARRSASNSPAPTSPLLGSSPQDLQGLARRCVSQLAPTYDLPGLLAGAIVFHRTATISASEAVRSVLTTTPGLMKGEAGEHAVAFSPSKRKLPGAPVLQKGSIVDGWPVSADAASERWTSISRKAWREHLEVVLQSCPMFGVIQRAGKDASGNPLEFWYYYDKENDPDKERAENLGVFAKPMRKALKGQKPIFWKRSGYASRQAEDMVEYKPSLGNLKDDVVTPSPVASTSASTSSNRVATGGSDQQESLDIANAPLPSSTLATGRKRKSAPLTSQISNDLGAITAAGAAVDDEEHKREKLRAKIAKSGLWDETQPEEKEKPTWDRKGDQDYRKSGRK